MVRDRLDENQIAIMFIKQSRTSKTTRTGFDLRACATTTEKRRENILLAIFGLLFVKKKNVRKFSNFVCFVPNSSRATGVLLGVTRDRQTSLLPAVLFDSEIHIVIIY